MWFRAANVAVGVWLMAAPAVLGYGHPAADFHRILGPVAAAVAIIAMAEVTRPFRWVNLPVGLALVLVPLLRGYSGAALANSLLCGTAVVALASLRGRVTKRVGGGWRSLRLTSTSSGGRSTP
jgi:hypothetical protein